MKNLFTFFAVIAMSLVSSSAMASTDNDLKSNIFDWDEIEVLSTTKTIAGMATESSIDGVWSHYDSYFGFAIVITVENGKYTIDMDRYGKCSGTVTQLSADTYLFSSTDGKANDTVTLTSDGKLKLGTEKFDRIG